MLLYGPYIDFIASTLGTVAVLAALDQRRATGKGAYLDVSQYECGLLFIAGELLDYHSTGHVAERIGNDDPGAAPHGAYPCADGGWLALSCWSDAERARLAQVTGSRLEEWLRERRSGDAAEELQRFGIHAHAVSSIAELFTDPQLAARRQWQRRVHEVIGEHSYCAPAFALSATPGEVTGPAPTLGHDNALVFRGLLGLSAKEFESYESAGAFA